MDTWCIGARCRPTIIGRREWQPSLRAATSTPYPAQHTTFPLRDELVIDYSVRRLAFSLLFLYSGSLFFGRPKFAQGLSFHVQKKFKSNNSIYIARRRLHDKTVAVRMSSETAKWKKSAPCHLRVIVEKYIVKAHTSKQERML